MSDETSDPEGDESVTAELLDRLRAADPGTDLPPADPTRVDRLLEDVMSDTRQDAPIPTPIPTEAQTRNPLTWLVAAAALVLIAAGGVLALAGGDDSPLAPPTAGSSGAPAGEVTTTELALPGGAPARCMVPSAEVLAGAAYAVDAEVTAVAGGTATLEPTTWYAGEQTDRVEVAAGSADLAALIGAPEFQVGQRYLVAGNGEGQVMVCGFSGPYDQRLAGLYAEAFGG